MRFLSYEVITISLKIKKGLLSFECIKMFQINQRICPETSETSRLRFAHAKVQKSIFNREILELVCDIGMIFQNDF